MNLPPGKYTLTATATGFAELKRPELIIEVGHLPTVDLTLSVGSEQTVLEVSSTSPLIDVTQTMTLTNITKEDLDLAPRGRSFQSVLTFAPGAQNEPLQGGVQIGGAATAENSYLIEGMTTNSPNTGKSAANAPFEFIQEVQVKTSGINAENGGALGAVINVIQVRGSNVFHGQVFAYYEGDPFDASPATTNRFNPQGSVNGRFDIPIKNYTPSKDHFRYIQPGALVSGYILKDRLWLSAALEPQYNSTRRTVNFTNATCAAAGTCYGVRTFNSNSQQYFSLARLDYKATERIRLFGSIQYQYYRETGIQFPVADSTQGLFNTSSNTNPDNFNLKFGYQLNHLLNNDNQTFQSSYTRIGWGTTWSPATATGVANCKVIEAQNLAKYGTTDNSLWTTASGMLVKTPNTNTNASTCQGAYGYITARDGVEVNGQAASNNTSFYGQDSFTAGKGITINAGLRLEKEYLPAYNSYPSGISFGWGDKVAPR